MQSINLLIIGVGGQGVVLASDIISEAALSAGYDVKKTDTLGMAQRGGSVVSHVRIAPHVWSPLIKAGEVDIMLAFEKLEAARWVEYLKPEAVVIVNNHALPPLSVNLGNERYPCDSEIMNILKQRSNRIFFIEGTKKARDLGDVRTLNTLMLGCASIFLPFEVAVWKDIIAERMPAKVQAINIAAFEQGRKEVQDVGS